MPIRNRIAELHPEITRWRQDIHANPELLYEVHRTAGVVANKLRAFGCDTVETGIGRTGVVGVIKGHQTTSGRTIALRADMDALPMFEATGAEHASTVPGMMHACGHDGHTAMLLGAAQYLAETRNFDGTVVVIFQPAEEGGNGAEAMIQDGVLERFDISEIYGMHNSPLLPLGKFAIRPGPFYAAVDMFEISVRGRGGHAARPNNTVDTTLAASAIVMGLQQVVARNTDPQQPAVLSVTSFRTESDAFNVIPEHVTLRGTIRTFDEEVREMVKLRAAEVASLTAQAHGAAATFDLTFAGCPPTVNHETETEYAAAAARAVAGEVDIDAPRTTGGEDFSFFLQACRGAYIQVGNGPTAGLHHPEYDFNDEVIPTGVSFWVELTEQRLPTQ